MPNTRMNLHFATRRQSRQLAEQLPLALHDRAVGPLTPSNSNAVTEITMRSELTPTSDGITFKFPTAHQFCEYGPRTQKYRVRFLNSYGVPGNRAVVHSRS